MEVIIEIIAELIHGKYPLWLKIPAILILALILIATIVIFGWLGIDCILKGHCIGGSVILILDILVILAIVVLLKEKNNINERI